MLTVNYLAIFLAAVSTMVIGAIWYSAKTPTGKSWMSWNGIKDSDFDNYGAKEMLYSMGGTFITSLLLAFTIAHVSNMSNQVLGGSQFQSSLSTAFFMWFGVTVAAIFSHQAFEGKPFKLTALNLAHDLVKIMVIGLIIGLMGW